MLKEKYTTSELKAKEPVKEKDKVVLSNDAYSIVDAIETLIIKIEHLRVNL